MPLSKDEDIALSRRARVVSLVIAGSMLFWIFAQWAGSQMGLAGKYAVLIDLFVLAAMFWSIVVSIQIWRKRRNS